MFCGYLKTAKPLLSPFLKPVTYMINELSLSRNHTIFTIVTIPTNNGDNVTKLATQANARKAHPALQTLRITSKTNSTLHKPFTDPKAAAASPAHTQHSLRRAYATTLL